MYALAGSFLDGVAGLYVFAGVAPCLLCLPFLWVCWVCGWCWWDSFEHSERDAFVSVFFHAGAIGCRGVCEVVASVELYSNVSRMPCCSCPFALEDLRFRLVAFNSRPVAVTYSGATIVRFDLVVA